MPILHLHADDNKKNWYLNDGSTCGDTELCLILREIVTYNANTGSLTIQMKNKIWMAWLWTGQNSSAFIQNGRKTCWPDKNWRNSRSAAAITDAPVRSDFVRDRIGPAGRETIPKSAYFAVPPRFETPTPGDWPGPPPRHTNHMAAWQFVEEIGETFGTRRETPAAIQSFHSHLHRFLNQPKFHDHMITNQNYDNNDSLSPAMTAWWFAQKTGETFGKCKQNNNNLEPQSLIKMLYEDCRGDLHESTEKKNHHHWKIFWSKKNNAFNVTSKAEIPIKFFQTESAKTSLAPQSNAFLWCEELTKFQTRSAEKHTMDATIKPYL